MKKLLCAFLVLSNLSFAAEPAPGIYISCKNLSGLPFPSWKNTFEFGRNKDGEWVFRQNDYPWRRAGNCHYSYSTEKNTGSLWCSLTETNGGQWPITSTYLRAERLTTTNQNQIYAEQKIKENLGKDERETTLIKLSGPRCVWTPGVSGN